MATALRADPAYFEDWDGQTEWVVEGPDSPMVFDHNPRSLVDEDDYALVRLHDQCDMGMGGRVWPDGRGLLDQPNLLIEAFDVIAGAKARAREAGRGRA